jgi:hypothetical protein
MHPSGRLGRPRKMTLWQGRLPVRMANPSAADLSSDRHEASESRDSGGSRARRSLPGFWNENSPTVPALRSAHQNRPTRMRLSLKQMEHGGMFCESSSDFGPLGGRPAWVRISGRPHAHRGGATMPFRFSGGERRSGSQGRGTSGGWSTPFPGMKCSKRSARKALCHSKTTQNTQSASPYHRPFARLRRNR